MSERSHAAEADQKIEAEGEDGSDQDLAREVDVKISRQERRQKQRSAKQGCADPLHAPTRPNRPCGRNAMTKIIGRNRMM